MPEQIPPAVDITLLVCTYNRCDDLRELLETAIAQETGGQFTYEILVVDNNSTDGTRQVVEELIAGGHHNLRYLFEGQQGKSHALNSGLKAMRGWAYAIVDDDFLLPRDWVKQIYEGFRTHPEVSFVSGKVLPKWQDGEPPAWLTQKHWSAIAMADYGETEFLTDQNNQLCLLACSFRLADVIAVGGYHWDLGPQKGRTGATEDLDLLKRLWKSGHTGLYLPHMYFYHKATADRVTKEYHRRWHRDHGRSYAVMRAEELEHASARLFDVPAHMYKQAAADTFGWVKSVLMGKQDEAFLHETQLYFFSGFFRKRREDFLATQQHGMVREIISFMAALATGKSNPRTPKEIG